MPETYAKKLVSGREVAGTKRARKLTVLVGQEMNTGVTNCVAEWTHRNVGGVCVSTSRLRYPFSFIRLSLNVQWKEDRQQEPSDEPVGPCPARPAPSEADGDGRSDDDIGDGLAAHLEEGTSGVGRSADQSPYRLTCTVTSVTVNLAPSRYRILMGNEVPHTVNL